MSDYKDQIVWWNTDRYLLVCKELNLMFSFKDVMNLEFMNFPTIVWSKCELTQGKVTVSS